VSWHDGGFVCCPRGGYGALLLVEMSWVVGYACGGGGVANVIADVRVLRPVCVVAWPLQIFVKPVLLLSVKDEDGRRCMSSSLYGAEFCCADDDGATVLDNVLVLVHTPKLGGHYQMGTPTGDVFVLQQDGNIAAASDMYRTQNGEFCDMWVGGSFNVKRIVYSRRHDG
jgi:hypothetical protein